MEFYDLVIIVLAACLAACAVLISVRHIYLHLSHYYVPVFQLHIVRILAMVPIYSLTSWLALISTNERNTLMLDLLRDTYEAYVIYNFVVLLINYGGGHLHLCRYFEAQPRMEHPWPGKLWLPPIKLGPTFLGAVRVSVLQFVFVKPVTSVFKLYLFFREAGALRPLYLILTTIVNNLSVSAALYGLVLFYHAADELLRPFRPFEKFISVKAIVFFSFWQGIALSAAVHWGLIHDLQSSTGEQATGLQDVLICLEMFIAAVAHIFVFSYNEYEADFHTLPEEEHRHPLLEVFDFRDVLSDARDRFAGGIGFGTELTEGAPIVPGVDNVFTESPHRPRPTYHPHPPSRVSISADLLDIPWKFSTARSTRNPS